MIFNNITITDIVAIIGAVTGILSCAYSWVVWHHNRRELVVSAKVMCLVGDPENKENIYVTIINKRERPVFVTLVNIIFKDGTTGFIKPTNIPKLLYEANEVTELILIDTIIDGNICCEIQEINVSDNLGEEWKAPLDDIKRINNKIKEVKNLKGCTH